VVSSFATRPDGCCLGAPATDIVKRRAEDVKGDALFPVTRRGAISEDFDPEQAHVLVHPGR
jgi:hypothetical protein